MESFIQLLFGATLIWFFCKLIGNSIKAGEIKEIKTKAKIDYLIGRWANAIYIQEDEKREETLEFMRSNISPHLKTALGHEMTEEMEENQELYKRTYELVMDWIRRDEEENSRGSL